MCTRTQMPRRYLLGVLVTFASACAASSVGSSSRSLGSVTPRSQSQLADPSADDVSPRLSTCLGRTTHCVMPDFDLGAVSYDFGAKKWQGGVTSIGVGYMLLFWSTSPLASGVALHGAGQFSQGQPSYFALTPTLVLARYFEAGCTLELADGGFSAQLTLGLGVAWDLLTGKTMGERLTSARAARAAHFFHPQDNSVGRREN